MVPAVLANSGVMGGGHFIYRSGHPPVIAAYLGHGPSSYQAIQCFVDGLQAFLDGLSRPEIAPYFLPVPHPPQN